MSYELAGLGIEFAASASASFTPASASGSVQQGPSCGSASRGPGCCDTHQGLKAFVENPVVGSFSAICVDGWRFARSGMGQPVVSSQGSASTVTPPPPPPPAAAPPPPAPPPIPGGPCPLALNTTAEPSGLSSTYRGYFPVGKVQPKICKNLPTDFHQLSTIFLCNLSANPQFCRMAKMAGLAYLGRGTASDVAKWKAWLPGQAPSPVDPAVLQKMLSAQAAPQQYVHVGTKIASDVTPTPPPVPETTGPSPWLLAAGALGLLALVGGAVVMVRRSR